MEDGRRHKTRVNRVSENVVIVAIVILGDDGVIRNQKGAKEVQFSGNSYCFNGKTEVPYKKVLLILSDELKARNEKVVFYYKVPLFGTYHYVVGNNRLEHAKRKSVDLEKSKVELKENPYPFWG